MSLYTEAVKVISNHVSSETKRLEHELQVANEKWKLQFEKYFTDQSNLSEIATFVLANVTLVREDGHPVVIFTDDARKVLHAARIAGIIETFTNGPAIGDIVFRHDFSDVKNSAFVMQAATNAWTHLKEYVEKQILETL